ncbi:MAG: hypothetical protein N2C14_32880 [Planctomycetales bacterium]
MDSWFWGPANGLMMGAFAVCSGPIWLAAALVFKLQWIYPAAVIVAGVLSSLRGVLVTQRRVREGESFGSQLLFDLKVWGAQLVVVGVLILVTLIGVVYMTYRMREAGNLLNQ